MRDIFVHKRTAHRAHDEERPWNTPFNDFLGWSISFDIMQDKFEEWPEAARRLAMMHRMNNIKLSLAYPETNRLTFQLMDVHFNEMQEVVLAWEEERHEQIGLS